MKKTNLEKITSPLEDGELFIAYLGNVSIRKGGSFIDSKTAKSVVYSNALKITFLLTTTVDLDFGGTIVHQDKIKTIEAMLIGDDEAELLSTYQLLINSSGARCLVSHNGIQQSNKDFKCSISDISNIVLIEKIQSVKP